ncbi:unnamed protein product [Triticum turgidum subsp. durum]|uniref:F-box associated beta-propeller type 3 domain-containing protein n=1 Tax=Triticum turgidum subsp. durum TaxID=4567 RepID=A0A9R1ANM9_TRITD|nr:unnamed protein product [Triticum turgidum subsp. durum]
MPDSGGATVLDDLPEWILVEEIFIRLPPRDIVRCRAVRKLWQSATSTDKFMLDHHRRQPFLPILSHVVEPQKTSLVLSFDADAVQRRLCPVIRTLYSGILEATCDGLLIVSHGATAHEFFICNPVTRRCAPLRTPQNLLNYYYQIVGFYRHKPSGQYRVLWVSCPTNNTNHRTFYCVIAVGSDYTRQIGQGCIRQPTSSSPSLELALRERLPGSSGYPPIDHRGSLHWTIVRYDRCDAGYIMVFKTADETFRLMCCPAQLPSQQLLLEIDGTLALCGISSDRVTVDVWVVQDYDAEAWSFKHRIYLSGMDESPFVDLKVPRMAVLSDGELLIQFAPRHVVRCDIDGRFVEYVKSEEDQDKNLWLTRHRLQESLIPLPLSNEMQEGGAASVEPPFFIGL